MAGLCDVDVPDESSREELLQLASALSLAATGRSLFAALVAVLAGSRRIVSKAETDAK